MKKSKIAKVLLSVSLATAMISGFSVGVNATANYAYSLGGLTTPVSQIISSADNWALCGYTSYYNTDITHSYLANSNIISVCSMIKQFQSVHYSDFSTRISDKK